MGSGCVVGAGSSLSLVDKKNLTNIYLFQKFLA